MPDPRQQDLQLPCGAAIRNRSARATTTAGLATRAGVTAAALGRFCDPGSEGGAGLRLAGR